MSLRNAAAIYDLLSITLGRRGQYVMLSEVWWPTPPQKSGGPPRTTSSVPFLPPPRGTAQFLGDQA